MTGDTRLQLRACLWLLGLKLTNMGCTLILLLLRSAKNNFNRLERSKIAENTTIYILMLYVVIAVVVVVVVGVTQSTPSPFANLFDLL